MIDIHQYADVVTGKPLATTERGIVDQIVNECFGGDDLFFEGWYEVISQWIDWNTYIDMAIQEEWSLDDLMTDIGATASP